jgi:hypothetical protein
MCPQRIRSISDSWFWPVQGFVEVFGRHAFADETLHDLGEAFDAVGRVHRENDPAWPTKLISPTIEPLTTFDLSAATSVLSRHMRSAEIDDLVDAFVTKVNSRQHERLPVKDVPQFLRRPSSGDERDQWTDDQWTDWQIHQAHNSGVIEDLEGRIGRRFPASYRSLVARYGFPAFDCGPLFFFANTGEETSDELSVRLFNDPNMSQLF